MQIDKLSKIIKDKNERLEREALGEAEDIISAIVNDQRTIKEAEERIAENREALKRLEIQQLDQSAVLGGE